MPTLALTGLTKENMLLLGIDIGTSSIKVSVVEAATQKCIISCQYPEKEETPILSPQPGWAEQSPDMWWEHTMLAIEKLNNSGRYNPSDIDAIGIAYQMHGLVIVDKSLKSLRNSIIWCDSRAVNIGAEAFDSLGHLNTLKNHLNSPGNFTASKLAWIKINEPTIYNKIYKVMLPGDFIALKLTGTVTTSISALSEGIFWDFQANELSESIKNYFGFEEDLFPPIVPLFSEHGYVTKSIAESLQLREGIPVSYKAGDQPNNALSLNVLEPGEVAATAGTSGVIYGVSDELIYDEKSRINTFAHVNYSEEKPIVGVLLCINGTGILNRWIRDQFGHGLTYEEMNKKALEASRGSNGLRILPFGNGAERILENKILGGLLSNIDLNSHRSEHIFRACQEGIAFAFRYGLDIMRENGVNPQIIRAGRANLFQSELFRDVFVNVTGIPVELYDNDGSIGAALGAGIGAGIFKSPKEAFINSKALKMIEPNKRTVYEEIYHDWKTLLNNTLNNQIKNQ